MNMGMAKLNVWIRNEQCKIVNKRAHLHVYSCHGAQVYGAALDGGHGEVALAPGCYILTAGIYTDPPGNVYTDKVMVVVTCNQAACVNLVLNRFGEEKLRGGNPHVPPIGIAQGGCAARLLGPLALNAQRMNIDPRDVRAAAGVIMKAAGMDPKALRGGIRSEVAFLRENLEGFKEDEREAARVYLQSLEGLADLVG
jgi:hypothetical protein